MSPLLLLSTRAGLIHTRISLFINCQGKIATKQENRASYFRQSTLIIIIVSASSVVAVYVTYHHQRMCKSLSVSPFASRPGPGAEDADPFFACVLWRAVFTLSN